ncbi:hypothetical protein O7635_37620 [Asanoa sp. WMMD1127]|uniref:hypothetical protein n=1 Tax=Asanoa sp. WMMD1127 TaxID=3016107 RepID=UPI00241698B9|nr:hypothetical protein [Asanoa sp. WMMD1127]MDG4827596.1 hypothetical protein [Asanoa sp. WMMD1127]
MRRRTRGRSPLQRFETQAASPHPQHLVRESALRHAFADGAFARRHPGLRLEACHYRVGGSDQVRIRGGDRSLARALGDGRVGLAAREQAE